MARVCLDYGHGGIDSGAVFNGRYEKDDNLALGLKVAEELRRHDVVVDETRTKDKIVSLKERSDFENKNTYDYFISLHRNASKADKAKGVETYIYNICRKNTKELAEKIQKALTDVGFLDRGVKTANFHVLRETKSPAVLIEVGFIDNPEDNLIFDNKKDEIAKGIAKAILNQLGIEYIEKIQKEDSHNILYRVIAGSFSQKENAEKQVNKLRELGIDAIIVESK
ncbi:MAG: N-acetylmuramoyl-L-alanine amidase [Caloramator sp.]|nr:N-acetylmuramoyl-L-alanine amidase [Caloramator sp.]